jgi:hypothetical protein
VLYEEPLYIEDPPPLCVQPGFVNDPPPLKNSSGPQPSGASLVDRAIALPGKALRSASREFEREIASLKTSGLVSDPPPGMQPTGQAIKSVETPDYLKENVRTLYS